MFTRLLLECTHSLLATSAGTAGAVHCHASRCASQIAADSVFACCLVPVTSSKYMVVNDLDRNAVVSVGGNGQYTLLNRLHQCVYIEWYWKYPVTAITFRLN